MAGSWGKFSGSEGGLEGERVTDFATQNLVNSGSAALPSFQEDPLPLQGLSPLLYPNSKRIVTHGKTELLAQTRTAGAGTDARLPIVNVYIGQRLRNQLVIV